MKNLVKKISVLSLSILITLALTNCEAVKNANNKQIILIIISKHFNPV